MIAVRKRIGTGLVLVAALGAVAIPFSTPASADGNHAHTVHSVANGLCLDVKRNYQANGTPVWLYPCNGTNAQNWTFRSLGIVNGSERFQIVDPYGYCLDAPAQYNRQAGHGVQIWGCNGGSTQIWDQTPGGLNPYVSQVHFALRNEYNGLWLDDAGYGGAGTQVITWPSNYGTNQQWVW